MSKISNEDQKKENNDWMNMKLISQNEKGDNITKYIMEGFYKKISSGTKQIQETSINEAEFKTNVSSDHETLRVFSMKNDDQFKDSLVPEGKDSKISNKEAKSPLFLNEKEPKLQSIEGFEKVIAQCIIGGERNFGAGYIGVKTEENVNKVFKATHSSDLQMQTTSMALMQDLFNDFKIGNYSNFTFNIDKFHEAMENVTKISEEEIKEIVKTRVNELKAAKVTTKGIQLSAKIINNVGSKSNPSKEILEDNNYDDINKYFERILIQNLQVSKNLTQNLAVLKLIDKDSNQTDQDHEKFKNGGWLKQTTEESFSQTFDAIAWASLNGKKIAGQDPIAWANLNGKKIAGHDPIAWEKGNKKYIEDARKLKAEKLKAENLSKYIEEIKNCTDASKLTNLYIEHKSKDKESDSKLLLDAITEARGKLVVNKNLDQSGVDNFVRGLEEKIKDEVNGEGNKPTNINDKKINKEILNNMPNEYLDKVIEVFKNLPKQILEELYHILGVNYVKDVTDAIKEKLQSSNQVITLKANSFQEKEREKERKRGNTGYSLF